jgi:hypothetical protein
LSCVVAQMSRLDQISPSISGKVNVLTVDIIIVCSE